MNNIGTTFWLIGIPSSGKTTLAKMVADRFHFSHLDSDVVRLFLTPKPSFSQSERELVYRSIIYCCKILNEHNHNVVVSATANLQYYRTIASEFILRYREIYIKCPISVCEERDVKGLYRLSREGKINTVPMKIVGVNDKYVDSEYGLVDIFEEPSDARLVVDTSVLSIDDSFNQICSFVKSEVQ